MSEDFIPYKEKLFEINLINPTKNEIKLEHAINEIEDHCPIKMEMIQLYAENFEKANIDYNNRTELLHSIQTKLDFMEITISDLTHDIAMLKEDVGCLLKYVKKVHKMIRS